MNSADNLDRRIDVDCDRFESMWAADDRPRVEEFLAAFAPGERATALEELLRVELELRQNSGEQAGPEEYLERFPGQAEVVRRVFGDLVSRVSGTRVMRIQPISDSGFHVRCPHCHNPIEMVPDAPLDSVDCPSCGSNFSLIHDENSSSDAPSVTSLGHFELLERIGMGAFGTVWKARDTRLDRLVAVKVPRKGQLEGDDQEKFLREARSAAQLRHPNIVSVHEVGREGDTLYIVSDLIRGVPLSELLADSRLSRQEVARLLIKAGNALHHAHEQGVVHRDLKPQNIMIDGDFEPHIMDFGLAKRDTGEITMTRDGMVLGTPAYMSPEQARGEAYRVDRTADVYSLGVILFQMLTGELPFRGTPRMLIHRVIHEEAPSPRRLDNTVPRDLETICLKCLQKEPHRRYSTAQEVSQELGRYERGESIRARPIGYVEKIWRWCRRNPSTAALGGILTAAMLSAAMVGPLVASRQASLRRQAEVQEADAVQARQEAEAVVEFLVETLKSPNPDLGGRHVKVAEVLEQAEDRLERDLSTHPAVRARMLRAIGSAYRGLGLPKEAMRPLLKAVELSQSMPGDNAEPIVLAMSEYGEACADAGRTDASIEMLEQAVELARAEFGEDHTDTLSTMNGLSLAYRAAGRIDEAIQLRVQVLEAARRNFGRSDVRILVAMNNLGSAYQYAGRNPEAIGLLEETLEIRRSQSGGRHSETLTAMHNLAVAYADDGRPDDAINLFEETARLRRELLGPAHPNTFKSIKSLASVYQDVGREEEALKLIEDSVGIAKEKLSIDHPDLPLALNTLALCHCRMGRTEDAIKILEETLESATSRLPTDHPNTLLTQHNLASMYAMAEQYDKAIGLMQETLAAKESKLGEAHLDTIRSMLNMSALYGFAERYEESLSLAHRCHNLASMSLGNEHPVFLMSLDNLAELYVGAGQLDEALKYHREFADRKFLSSGRYSEAILYWPALSEQLGDWYCEAAVAADVGTLEPREAAIVAEMRIVAGRFELAEAAIHDAVSRADGSSSTWFQTLGWCLDRNEQPDRAQAAFYKALAGLKQTDNSYNLGSANQHELTAAFFLDLISEEEYAERLERDADLASIPWFFIGQRRERLEDVPGAVQAYEYAAELADESTHPYSIYAAWRLGDLNRQAAE